MIIFPTNLKAPAYPLPHSYEENLIKSPAENGYQIVRVKFTRQRKSWPSIQWKVMDEEEWEILEEFYRDTTVFGSLPFEWEHPTEGTIYLVRFIGSPKPILIQAKKWQVEIGLEEV